MSTDLPQVGDRAPDFSLPATGDRNPLSLKDLRGAPVVLYFYPKDATPGCTTQACDFRDHRSAMQAIGAQVVGVSPDSLASHERFTAKQGLNFPLVADEAHEAATAYGVWQLKKMYGREYMGIVRSTFLIDAEGVIRRVWTKVRVKGHIEEVQEALAAL